MSEFPIKKGIIIIYDNRICKVVSVSENKVILTNLSKINKSDWNSLEISLDEIKN